jgi:uncharacterized protein YebE (UPF0316 family)
MPPTLPEILSFLGYLAERFVSVLPTNYLIPWDLIHPVAIPILIFALRAVEMTMATLRMLAVIQSRRMLAWFFGILQATIFITAISGVLGNLQNFWTIIAYAAGFASGIVFGMMIEGHVAPGHSLLRIISPGRANAIVEALWNNGHGATEISAKGISGMVGLVLCFIPRRAIRETREEILKIDPEAFITVEYVREQKGGWKA